MTNSKTCEQCGKEFTVNCNNHRFCSHNCEAKRSGDIVIRGAMLRKILRKIDREVGKHMSPRRWIVVWLGFIVVNLALLG